MAVGDDWTRSEVEAAVAAYRDMLLLELKGASYNKAASNREVQDRTRRGKGSIEFKHQNISAVLNEMGLPYIEGYKPRSNYQNLLQQVVVDVISSDLAIQIQAEQVAERQDFSIPDPKDSQTYWVDAPKPEKELYQVVKDSPVVIRPIIGKNYLEIESRNRSLGLAGEKLVLELEHRRLWQAGHKQLADSIEHVSRTKGDGLGYDIISFETDGRERLIEVKTTQFGILTPFFATKNEVEVSREEAERYQLYRVFSFLKQPRLFALPGSLGRSCLLDPTIFRATPRS